MNLRWVLVVCFIVFAESAHCIQDGQCNDAVLHDNGKESFLHISYDTKESFLDTKNCDGLNAKVNNFDHNEGEAEEDDTDEEDFEDEDEQKGDENQNDNVNDNTLSADETSSLSLAPNEVPKTKASEQKVAQQTPTTMSNSVTITLQQDSISQPTTLIFVPAAANSIGSAIMPMSNPNTLSIPGAMNTIGNPTLSTPQITSTQTMAAATTLIFVPAPGNSIGSNVLSSSSVSRTIPTSTAIALTTTSSTAASIETAVPSIRPLTTSTTTTLAIPVASNSINSIGSTTLSNSQNPGSQTTSTASALTITLTIPTTIASTMSRMPTETSLSVPAAINEGGSVVIPGSEDSRSSAGSIRTMTFPIVIRLPTTASSMATLPTVMLPPRVTRLPSQVTRNITSAPDEGLSFNGGINLVPNAAGFFRVVLILVIYLLIQ
jgi:hypothetical protein